MKTWVLLERTEQLLLRLYQAVGAPNPIYLFDATELAVYTGQSPILLEQNEPATVHALIQQSPLDWPGLILHSEHSTATVLAHLRNILLVRFEQHRLGVLRYSNPTTARYFFGACGPDTLKNWLGPINRLTWFGGTWREQATGQTRWHTLENPGAADDERPVTRRPTLNSDLQQALARQQQEHFLYQWWLKHPGTAFAHAWQWLEEGINLSFLHALSLERYLTLRSTYASCAMPLTLPSGPDQARLDYLQSHLQRPHAGQES